MKIKNTNKYYEIFISLLSLIISIIVLCEATVKLRPETKRILGIVDNIIWIIFIVDYCVKLILSKDKLYYIKKHKIDFLSIIPFNPVFQSLRIVNIFKLIRISSLIRFTTFIYKFKERLSYLLFFDNFKNILFLTLMIILAGAGGISIAEKLPFGEALWYSIVTATTVGYGDIIPSTFLGRTISTFMMLTGIGAVGALTGTITLFVLENNKRRKPYKEVVIDEIKQRLDDFDRLNEEDLKIIYEILLTLKSKKVDK